MKVVVLIKQVPDTGGDRNLDKSTGLLDRRGARPSSTKLTNVL